MKLLFEYIIVSRRPRKTDAEAVPCYNQIPEPIYDFTKPEGHVKAAGPRDREEDSNSVINDYTSESISKESNSTKKNEAKLRTTSDKEC